MTRIGIIGTGMLGGAVALRLLDTGHDVTVYNRTPAKTQDAVKKGASQAASPKEVAENSDLVLVIVRDAKAVRQVSFGDDGLSSGIHDGLVIADMSTISPSESREIAAEFEGMHVKKLDIPVMGGPNVAVTGDLVMMVSGDKKTFERCKGALGDIASRIFFLGGSGDASSVKLAMNLQITMLALGLAEGITLVRESGMDPRLFLEVLNSTYFKTGMSEKKAYRMIDGNHATTFTLANLKKDISTMVRAAESLGVSLPMTKKAEEIYKDAINEGLGGTDYTGIIDHIKKNGS
ncbi:MAG: NAD(P)-dependent oxidoreductase [Nitrosopumilus sp. H8]|nr:MAG: NAD(P)-dependent oxidoreductase [Nitrosopumilus sp. H8]